MNEQTLNAISNTLTELLDAFTQAHQSAEVLLSEIQLYVPCQDLKRARTILINDHHKPTASARRPHWPHPPSSEVETDRNGQGGYLYLYWSQDKGPAGSNGRPRRRVYIGNKPRQIELAREMSRNSTDLQILRRQLDQLSYNTTRARSTITQALRILKGSPT